MSVRIQILGAGVAGLSLACHLEKRNIPFKLFERGSQVIGHNYGIDLYQQSCTTLDLKLSTEQFLKHTAVDRLIGGRGKSSQGFKVSDAEFRKLLSRPVHWNHNVTACTPTPNGLKLHFDNGEESVAPITVDTSGLNSPIIASLLPDLTPEVLPYVVYHGSRYVTEDPMNDNEIDIKAGNHHIQLKRSVITIESVPKSLQANFDSDIVYEIRYTISRPAVPEDPIFNPIRSKSEAKKIPEAFYREVAELDLPEPWKTFLSTMRDDRVLNWLMRKQLPSLEQMQDLADAGVLAIGDAGHGLPILGSEGANIALVDARAIVDSLDSQSLMSFYKSRMDAWEQASQDSEDRLKNMHEDRLKGAL